MRIRRQLHLLVLALAVAGAAAHAGHNHDHDHDPSEKMPGVVDLSKFLFPLVSLAADARRRRCSR
jgi:hypothetical protein